MADEPQVPEVAAPARAAANSRYAWPRETRLLGKSTPRVDGPAKVTGAAVYTYDVQRPGMLYGRILRSPHAHARVVSIDVASARAMAGVKAIVPVIEVNKKVMFQGDEVVALAATTEEIADDAVRAIRVVYEVLPHLATIEQAMSPAAPAIFEGGNTRVVSPEEDGDLAAGFAKAAHTVSGTYETQVQTHQSLETHGCVCEWNGDQLTAWVSTQAVHGTREGFAQALEIPMANVRVICDHFGGGFGSKFGPDVQGIVCAKLARQAGAPVKLMLDRKEEQLASGNRPSAAARIRAGVAADGRLTAFDAESWGTGGAGAGAGFPLPYIYDFPARRRLHTDVYINAGQQRAMRAPGHPQACFITEVLMDELADAVGMDPVEFRIRNLRPRPRTRSGPTTSRLPPTAWDGAAATRPATPRPGRSSAGWGVPPTAGAVAGAARRRTARFTPTAASSCAAGRRMSASGPRRSSR